MFSIYVTSNQTLINTRMMLSGIDPFSFIHMHTSSTILVSEQDYILQWSYMLFNKTRDISTIWEFIQVVDMKIDSVMIRRGQAWRWTYSEMELFLIYASQRRNERARHNPTLPTCLHMWGPANETSSCSIFVYRVISQTKIQYQMDQFIKLETLIDLLCQHDRSNFTPGFCV